MGNPLSETVLLPCIAALLPANTQLAAGSVSGTGQECVYVAQWYALSQGSFPAVLVSVGKQWVSPAATGVWAGEMEVYVDYYDRWDRQTLPIDPIRADIALDLQIMLGNITTYLREQEGVLVNGVVYPLSLLRSMLSGYVKATQLSALGMVLAYHRLTLVFNTLPYSAI